ncbi:MAG: type II toxin-antitoxin system VapC family toxin [Ktedonobacteraceae bacterium]
MNNVVVVDASIAVKWVVNEEDSDVAKTLLTKWGNTKMVVTAPSLLIYEITNIFYRHVQSGKLQSEDAKKGLDEIINKTLTFRFSPNTTLSLRAMELAHQFGLSATYDAHYLALAELQECELWTADTRMWRAVKGKLSWIRSLGDYHSDTS